MKKFKVIYSFDGNGEVEIEAETAEEARDEFFSGEFNNEKEWGENYNVENVEDL